MSDEMLSGLLGALVGAIVGSSVSGAISFFLTLREASEKRKDDHLAKRQRQRALAKACLIKLKILTDSAFTDVVHMREALGPEWRNIEDRELSAKYRPIVGGENCTSTTFETEELIIFLDMGIGNIMNDAIILALRSSVANALMQRYEHRREGLTPYVVKIEGNGATYATTDAIEGAKLQMLVADLGELAVGIRDLAIDRWELGNRVLNSFAEKGNEFFDDVSFAEVIVPTDAIEQALARRAGQS